MSHKNCGCNDCSVDTLVEKAGDDKILKQPIKMMKEPPVETFLFTPEEDEQEVWPQPKDDIYTWYMENRAGKFQTIDTGNKQTFSTGMQRNVAEGKPRYDLIWKPGLKRLAELYARGAKVYGDRNWEKASTQEEMDRFDESLLRHTYQLLEGDRTEDHMAAILFNAFGREMVREKLGK